MQLKTRVTLGLATVGAAIGAVLVPTTSAFAAPAPLTVTWANQASGLHLQDGDTATVSGTGFPASTQVFVSECSTLTGGAADCDSTPNDGGLALGMTDPSGAFTANLFVRTETLGSATCGASSVCHAVATTDPNAPDPSTNTSAGDLPFDNLQISPRTNLKTGTALNLIGAGYKANSTVYVTECTDTDPTKALQRCDVNSVETYPTDANGTFTGVYHKTHTGPAVSQTGPYPCNPGTQCIVAGSDSITNPSAADAHIGGAVVTFANLTATKTTASAPKHAAKNAKFAVKGKVKAAGSALAGVKVTLYKLAGGKLTKIGKPKTTSSTGGVKFKGLSQKKTTKYELKTAASSAKYTAGSHSKAVKVSTP